MNNHAVKVYVEVVVGPDPAREDLDPDCVVHLHLHHGALAERVVLKVVRVVAAGKDDPVVAEEHEAVVALYSVAVKGEDVGAGSGSGEYAGGHVHPAAGVDVAAGVGQVAGNGKVGAPATNAAFTSLNI